MKKPMFAIRDVKTSFMNPFVDENDESAIRGFSYSVKNQPGIIGFSPADFSLYRVAFFDTLSGTVEPVDPPVFLVSATSFFTERS